MYDFTKKNLKKLKETLNWINACLCSNFDRTKLASRLEKTNQKKTTFSSEGFLINLYDVMLDISNVFLDHNNPKVKINYYIGLNFFQVS